MMTAKQRARERSYFDRVRRAELGYAQQLRKIARHVGEIIRAYKPGDSAVVPEIISVLQRYADVITPWARASALRMITEVARRDQTAWAKASATLGRNLRQEIRDTPIGDEV